MVQQQLGYQIRLHTTAVCGWPCQLSFALCGWDKGHNLLQGLCILISY